MDLQELADELRAMYDSAPQGDQAWRFHWFGVRHAAALNRFAPASVVACAGLPHSYGTELTRGAIWRNM